MLVHTSVPFKKKAVVAGSLMHRTADSVVLSQKGRLVNIPRSIVKSVRFPNVSG